MSTRLVYTKTIIIIHLHFFYCQLYGVQCVQEFKEGPLFDFSISHILPNTLR